MEETKKNLGGRPKAIVAREKVIKIRCTPMEKAMIENLAESTGLTTANYCRSVVLDYSPKAKLTDEEEEAYKTLVEYKTNFKRISNYIQNNQAVSDEILKLCKELDKHLKNILK